MGIVKHQRRWEPSSHGCSVVEDGITLAPAGFTEQMGTFCHSSIRGVGHERRGGTQKPEQPPVQDGIRQALVGLLDQNGDLSILGGIEPLGGVGNLVRAAHPYRMASGRRRRASW